MAFLGIIGKRFKDVGLSDIIIESGVVAEGSINGVMTGKHYNRSLQMHKHMFTALNKMLWVSFLDTVSEEMFSEIYQLSKETYNIYSSRHLNEDSVPEKFNTILLYFNEFILKNSNISPIFAFWFSYLDIVSCLLRFIRATRKGDWPLHL